MEHTPLPWSWWKGHLVGPKDKGASTWILRCAADCEPIPEDATFIVRAVNSHYKLLSALEPLARLAEDSPPDAPDDRCLHDGAFESLSLGDARRAREAVEEARK